MNVDRRKFVCIAAAGSLPLAGCGGGGDGGDDGEGSPTGTETGNQTPTPSADEVVEIDSTFEPPRISVDVGTTVMWDNTDMVAHTVTNAQFHDVAESWSFDEQVSPRGSVRRTFDSAGVYEYYCTIHGEDQMCGAVLVGDVSLEASLPCEDDGTATEQS